MIINAVTPAKNTEAERRACEIRLRAERKAGKLAAKLERTQGKRTDIITSAQRGAKSYEEQGRPALPIGRDDG